MIGDQPDTEALECPGIRLRVLVGERCSNIEAVAKAAVELLQVRMQT